MIFIQHEGKPEIEMFDALWGHQDILQRRKFAKEDEVQLLNLDGA